MELFNQSDTEAPVKPLRPTDRRAQTKMASSDKRMDLLIEAVTDYAIFMLDCEGYISTWNIGAERIHGYRAQEILGKHFSGCYLPEDVAAGKAKIDLET